MNTSTEHPAAFSHAEMSKISTERNLKDLLLKHFLLLPCFFDLRPNEEHLSLIPSMDNGEKA